MAQIAVAPLVLKDVTLTIGTDTYEKHVDQVTFTPSAQTITWTGLGSNPSSDITTATWTCTLNYAQDWTTTDSLSQYLLANEGTTVSMTFKPASGSAQNFTADVIITPGAIGGSVNQFALSSVTLPVDGAPTYSAT